MSTLAQKGGCWLGAQAYGPSSRSFIALPEGFRATGSTVPGEIVRRLLDVHQVGDAVRLAKLDDTGGLCGFERCGNLWMSMLEFRASDLALTTGPQWVRAQAQSLCSGWQLTSCFAKPNAQFNGNCPASTFASCVDAVLRAANSMTRVEELGHPLVRQAHEVAARV